MTWRRCGKICCTKVGCLPMAAPQHQWVAISSSTAATATPQSPPSPDYCLFWWQRILLTDKMRAFLFLWNFVSLVLHVASGAGGHRNSRYQNDSTATQSPDAASQLPCSRVCQCEAGAVDCSNRGLTQVPLDLPKDADKM